MQINAIQALGEMICVKERDFSEIFDNEGIGMVSAYTDFDFGLGYDDNRLITPYDLQWLIDSVAKMPIPPSTVCFDYHVQFMWFAQLHYTANDVEDWIKLLQPFLAYLDTIKFCTFFYDPLHTGESIELPYERRKGIYQIPCDQVFTKENFSNGTVIYSGCSYIPTFRHGHDMVDDLNGVRLTGEKLYNYLAK